MSNIETYLGVKLFIQEELDPFKITYLNEKAYKIAGLVGFDANDFFVYVHNLSIIQRTEGYFASKIDIEKRINKLEVIFDVNPKQIKKHQIRFFNAQAGLDVIGGVEEYYGDTTLIRMYPGSLIKKYHYFNTELITYVSKTLRRRDHRKIKITVQGYPTDYFYQYIHSSSEYHETKIDLRLYKDANLHLKNLTIEEKKEIEYWLSKHHLPNKEKGYTMELTVLIGTISTILNVIDSFIGISEKFSSGKDKQYSVKAQKSDESDSIEILRDGKIEEKIAANQLKLNYWDNVRVNSLKKRIDRNWRIFNKTNSSLPLKSPEDRARIEEDMYERQQELCSDFREMIKIFESTLGVSLNKYYTLPSICCSEV